MALMVSGRSPSKKESVSILWRTGKRRTVSDVVRSRSGLASLVQKASNSDVGSDGNVENRRPRLSDKVDRTKDAVIAESRRGERNESVKH